MLRSLQLPGLAGASLASLASVACVVVRVWDGPSGSMLLKTGAREGLWFYRGVEPWRIGEQQFSR